MKVSPGRRARIALATGAGLTLALLVPGAPCQGPARSGRARNRSTGSGRRH
ncbi:hypothetical protein [Kitasatospora griseola]|uniref:hypothetical protein n=1 Tax=Kitasatospora griseola TaxID=2064 RepID=UPI000AA187B9|nr:hypothetical protein [Kitasatospora griseola]